MAKQSWTLAEVAELLGASLRGDEQERVSGLAPIDQAGPGDLCFLTDMKYRDALKSTRATAVMLAPELAAECPTNALITDNPYLAFARVATALDQTPHCAPGIHPSAVVADSAQLGKDVAIGPCVVIGENVTIGDGTELKAHCVVEDGTTIGAHCVFMPRVTLYHHCEIGDRVVVQSGAVIGSDGFGMAKDENNQWVKIPQLGKVVIGSDVEVGANTTIDRGALGDTVIANNVKLDNQIQIGHNVQMGEGTAMAACSGIAGSTKVGKHCLFGGAVGIAGHLTIADQVMLTAQSGVSKSIETPGVYSASIPSLPVKEWYKIYACIKKLPQLAQRLKVLEKKEKS